MGTKRVLNVVASFMAVLFLAAGVASAADKVLPVGVLGPFTGPSAQNGKEFKASVEMAMDAIDYTVGDYKIEVVWVDSQSDPARAA
ncbi:MAG: ABC transporter substrate-binding protein, partial [Desulfotignum sp.]